MRQRFGVLACWVLTATAGGQPGLLWGVQFGTVAPDQVLALVPDGSEGVFIAGETEGDLGGPSAGGYDAFLGRYDKAGNRIWFSQFGTNRADRAQGLAPDGAGGIYAGGTTDGDLGGKNKGSADAWIARYDGAGTRLWLAQFGGTATDWPTALAPDGSGGAFIGGLTGGLLGEESFGGWDAWIARFDSSGNRLWVVQFGTGGDDRAFALAPDGAGGVVGTGYMHSGGEAWIARYDSAGSQLWMTLFGSNSDDQPMALAPDGAGGAFVAGFTWGDLGGPNAGGRDPWLARFDGSGNQVWARQFGTAFNDWAFGVAVDGSGLVRVTGFTEGSLSGPNAGGTDVFVSSHDAAGNPAPVTQFGTGSNDEGLGLAPDGADGVFVCGMTGGDLYAPPAGDKDCFLARLGAHCYADLIADGALDLFDFLAFVNLFNATDPGADCDGNAALDLFDFLCFTNAFNAGC